MRKIERSDYQRSLKLGEIIQFLASCDPDKNCQFDFARIGLEFINSSRGSYDELAIGYKDNSCRQVKNVLTEFEACVGTSFEGYKGGNYQMGLDTLVWVDNWGDWTGTALKGIVENDFEVIFLTEKELDR